MTDPQPKTISELASMTKLTLAEYETLDDVATKLLESYRLIQERHADLRSVLGLAQVSAKLLEALRTVEHVQYFSRNPYPVQTFRP